MPQHTRYENKSERDSIRNQEARLEASERDCVRVGWKAK